MKILILFAAILLVTPQNEAFLIKLEQLSELAKGVAQTVAGVTSQGSQVAGNLLGQAVAGAGTVVGNGLSTFVNSLSNQDPGRRRAVNGFVSDIELKVQEIIEDRKSALSTLATAALIKLQQKSELFGDLDFLKQPVSKIVTDIDRIIASHQTLSDAVLGDIVQKIKSTVRVELNKLNLGQTIDIDKVMETVDATANTLLKSDEQLVHQVVTNIGNSLKSTATKLITTFQKHVSADHQDVDQALADLNKVVTEGKKLIEESGQKALKAIADKMASR